MTKRHETGRRDGLGRFAPGWGADRDLLDRVTDKVEVSDGCYTWTGSLDRAGYGKTWDGSHVRAAHRVVYELVVGPIPDGMDLDHLCRNPPCVNPDHLEPVSRQENLLRGATIPAAHAAKTHCLRGHPFDEANTYHYRGMRMCRACHRICEAARRERLKSA